MKLVINIFGIDIELEGEIDKEEKEEELIVRIKNLDNAILKVLGIKR